jgi:hypothetical protein
MVLAPFKLRCCDMDSGKRLQELQGYNENEPAH